LLRLTRLGDLVFQLKKNHLPNAALAVSSPDSANGITDIVFTSFIVTFPYPGSTDDQAVLNDPVKFFFCFPTSWRPIFFKQLQPLGRLE